MISEINIRYSFYENCRIDETAKINNNLDIEVFTKGFLFNREELCRRYSLCDKRTDAEIIVEGYKKKGIAFIKDINGDITILIIDYNSRAVLLCKDPMGRFGVYFRRYGNELHVATEITRFGICQYNPDYLATFLSSNILIGFIEESPINGVKKVSNGSIFEISQKKIEKHDWKIKIPTSYIKYNSPNDYNEQFLSLFKQSIIKRSLGKKKLMSHLSGGLDSSGIVGALKDISLEDNYQISSMSLVFQNTVEANEREFIDLVSEYTGIKNFKMNNGDDFWALKDCFNNNLPVTNEPSADLLFYSLRRSFSEFSSNHSAEIVYSGYGADQVLDPSGGLIYLTDLLKKHNYKQLIQDTIKWSNSSLKSNNLTAWKILGNYVFYPALGLKTPIDFIKDRYEPSINGSIYPPPFLTSSSIELLKKVNDEYNEFKKYNMSYPLSIQSAFLMASTVNDHWWKDALSPQTIEMYPYLDRNLIEFVLAVPPNIKMTPESRKLLQRQSFKQILPEAILNRKWHGQFVKWTYRGIKNEMSNITKLFENSILVELGVVDKEKLKVYLNNMKFGLQNSGTFHLWTLLSLELWLNNWTVKSS